MCPGTFMSTCVMSTALSYGVLCIYGMLVALLGNLAWTLQFRVGEDKVYQAPKSVLFLFLFRGLYWVIWILCFLIHHLYVKYILHNNFCGEIVLQRKGNRWWGLTGSASEALLHRGGTELRRRHAGCSASQVNEASSMAVTVTVHTYQEGGHQKSQDMPSGVRWVASWKYLAATLYSVLVFIVFFSKDV